MIILSIIHKKRPSALADVPVLLYKNQAGKAAQTASGPNHYAKGPHYG